jgi:hypothetical protein
MAYLLLAFEIMSSMQSCSSQKNAFFSTANIAPSSMILVTLMMMALRSSKNVGYCQSHTV